MTKKEIEIIYKIFSTPPLRKSRLFPKDHLKGYNSCMRGLKEIFYAHFPELKK